MGEKFNDLQAQLNENFDSKDFKGVVLDESSILKNFDGKIKSQITEFVKKIPYRILSTARIPLPWVFISRFLTVWERKFSLNYWPHFNCLPLPANGRSSKRL